MSADPTRHAELPFELAQRLLIACEDVLVSSPRLPDTPLWRVFRWARDVFDSLLLNFHGASRMSSSIVTTFAFSIVIPAVSLGVLRSFGFISHEQAWSYTYAGWMLLAVAIAFSKPSRYALTGYSRAHANRVIERMPDLHTCTIEALSAIQSCIQRAEDETKARLVAIKWIAGAVFAVAIYLAQKGFDLKSNELFNSALLPLTFAAIIAGCIAVHARAIAAAYGLAYASIHLLETEANFSRASKVTRTRWLVRSNAR